MSIRLHPHFPTVLIGTQGLFPVALAYKEEDALAIVRAMTRDERFPALEKAIHDAIHQLEESELMIASIRLHSALNVFRSA